ncbi:MULTISPECIES: hypothetical protein [Vibrio]|uniref:hypothetical protein n=1 Tax=Vibrio TaxID=662 RepID=UPI0005440364|nr:MULTISPECIES: hypothetical protein [Vibrio]EGQ8481021.1 hypothetical protein [Vibrio parahaemolyticus]EGR1790744.1 hypothetical protein [Vibrio parahaemolyticus]EJG2230114.1 hypothetical protein [Vibrio parahaemolyticus]EKZ9011092.1 hypothetical protein [Vibrio alginolyticus]ELA7187247.1 hypothetical protein [Vibrio alginolyticus]
MKFIKENCLDYIKRIVETNNSDPENRKITRVEVNPNEWDEIAKTYPVSRNQYSLRIALCNPTNVFMRARSSHPRFNVPYDEIEIVMKRTEHDEDF